MGYDYQTSLLAFQEIQEKIPECQQQVLRALKILKEATNMEIADFLGWSINRVTPRTKELRDKDFVEQATIRPCKITGRAARAWKLAQKGVDFYVHHRERLKKP